MAVATRQVIDMAFEAATKVVPGTVEANSPAEAAGLYWQGYCQATTDPAAWNVAAAAQSWRGFFFMMWLCHNGYAPAGLIAPEERDLLSRAMDTASAISARLREMDAQHRGRAKNSIADMIWRDYAF